MLLWCVTGRFEAKMTIVPYDVLNRGHPPLIPAEHSPYIKIEGHHEKIQPKLPTRAPSDAHSSQLSCRKRCVDWTVCPVEKVSQFC